MEYSPDNHMKPKHCTFAFYPNQKIFDFEYYRFDSLFDSGNLYNVE